MQSSFWRKCRVCIRWFRRVLLVAVVALICAFVWFDRVGVPDFLQRRLVESLRARGVELEFSRLRFSLFRGLIAENVRVGHPVGAEPDSPALSAREVRLELNDAAALRWRLQLDGLVLNQGQFVLPLSPTNALTLDDIQTELRFQANDTWSLDNFKAGFAGAKLALSGDVAHAPEIRDWEIFRSPRTGRGTARTQLKKFSDALRQIHFTGAPQLTLNVSGDARDVHSFNVRLAVTAPAVRSPWAGARNIQLTARLTAPADAPTNFDASWSWWTNLQPYRVVWTARLAQLKSDQLNADSVSCGGFWRAPELALTNLSAELGGGWLEGRVRLNVATREFVFTNVSRFDLHAVAALLTDKTRERLAEFSWTEPPSVSAGGSLVLPAWIPLMRDQPDWRGEVRPTIQLLGELAFTNGAAFGAKIDSAHAHFSYSNLVWRLPDVTVAQSKTRLEIGGSEDDATKDYRWRVRGAFDPECLRPFLTTSNAVRGLGIVQFTEPARLDADVRGRLYDYDRIGATGRVALTNFTVRGQSMDNVTGEFSYTNRVLEFSHPRLWRGAQTMTADTINLDFNRKLIFFKNGYSTADPEAVTRAIGPKTARIMEPYHFLQPPTVFVEGCVPLRDINGVHDVGDADLRFDVVGGVPFQCLKLRAARITGTVHWLGETLILTNVAAELYGGSGSGFANFDFRVPHEGADYQFTASVANINLHALASDLSSPTNHLEGALSGQMVVTRADTRDWRTLDGFGEARLRDGLIWDIPLFGILSPVLNAVSPDLGNSRATDARAKFAITNGVIYSDSLEINTAMTRLQYAGTVNLRENVVDARVTAQLLHNLWGVGPLVSPFLWPVSKVFEYQVTGTLENLKKEPVHDVSKVLLMPLHPIRTLEEFFPGSDTFSSPTNAPPEN
jgi:hypothetical protein